ncbi:D-glycero-beta-D-manno-heptose 1-phosphate adenylyltransferase [Mucilaginibacter auburnensis]|uniref:D-glycero-beta-D-manno-heptose 1-phosphate adenylyltransferase n=1 Tax=Mucilaginibacter auburnensis TaxID=1457233 RepID=A0A2H9VUM6_9SPHI|nr:D-glycero-beta-D-manno-heptose 1-phosphate adenylyltransferase [Mucilaginibacter auburnensis]PJJ84534.1 rfaE bifunctional protein nucleotidyltransferase chain/domain [Mucilaginibacter auburnensis]
MRTQLEHTLLNKITDIASLKRKIAMWKFQGEKVVFSNGVFDLLHTGHITYLTKAAELGERLIIGLNTDSSVKRLKGPERPVNDQNSRALLLAALFFVDAIVLFDDDTPLNLITELQPDILVKGADYTIDKIVGAKEVLANGGEVKTIDFVDGFSSTSIIQKIKGNLS